MLAPVRHAACAVVLVPALADRDLHLVVAGGEGARAEDVDPVAVRVLQPGAQAVGLPVARAPELALEAAGRHRDHLVVVVRDPVRLVRVVELDGGLGQQAQRDVGSAASGALRRSSRPRSRSARPCTPSRPRARRTCAARPRRRRRRRGRWRRTPAASRPGSRARSAGCRPPRPWSASGVSEAWAGRALREHERRTAARRREPMEGLLEEGTAARSLLRAASGRQSRDGRHQAECDRAQGSGRAPAVQIPRRTTTKGD